MWIVFYAKFTLASTKSVFLSQVIMKAVQKSTDQRELNKIKHKENEEASVEKYKKRDPTLKIWGI